MTGSEKAEYRKYGRRKAGTWGKPHKGRRKAANRATRTLEKRACKNCGFTSCDSGWACPGAY